MERISFMPNKLNASSLVKKERKELDKTILRGTEVKVKEWLTEFDIECKDIN
jgi:hypothetical protein